MAVRRNPNKKPVNEQGSRFPMAKARKNTWKDEGEAKDGIDDKIKRKPSNSPPRPPAAKKTVRCTVCHQDKQVPTRIHVSKWSYRCEDCV